jgi:ankyrin repeat protein
MLMIFLSLSIFPVLHRNRMEQQLIRAAEAGEDLDLIKRLIAEGADVNATNKHGHTALMA